MAEIELNVLAKQCLNRRIAKMKTAVQEVEAWTENRNNMEATIDGYFGQTMPSISEILCHFLMLKV
jgi:hypothetical protein